VNLQRLDWLRKPTVVSLLLGFAASLLVIGLRSAGLLQFVELATYDAYLRVKEHQSVREPRVVLVQTVEEDIQKLKEWPLSDRRMTETLRKILAGNPRAVGVDLYRDIPVPPGTDDLNVLLLREKRIVVIEKFGKDATKKVSGPPALEGTEQIGFSDVTPDDDGVVRRGLLFLDDGKTSHVSLALRLALIYLADEGITPQPDPAEPSHIRLGKVTLRPFEASDGSYVGADADGYQYMLDYRGGADRFGTYSLTDVLEGRVDPGAMRDRIVIFGVNAESVKDEFLTPFDRFTRRGHATAGVAVHGYEVSQLIRAALEGDEPMRFLSDLWEIVWILLWGLVAALVGRIVRTTMPFTLSIAAGLLVLVGVTLLAFVQHHLWLPVAPVAIAWVGSAGLVTAFLSGHERQEKRFLMDIFSRSVSPAIADEMWKQRASFVKGGRLAPQTMTVTVLFSDLMNFTPVAERLTPDQLMDWLNDYMETMAGLVIAHGGVVDDYYGDAIKSNFGVPLPRTKAKEIRQDAVNALRCALAMRKKMEELVASWSFEGPQVKVRVGIATGQVVAGCLGSAQRMKYTTIGDVVNTAARLETYGKEIPERLLDPYCQVMVAASTVAHLGDEFRLEPVGTLQLKGKSQGVEVFALMGTNEAQAQSLPAASIGARSAAG
jgi:adenylate cyclase